MSFKNAYLSAANPEGMKAAVAAVNTSFGGKASVIVGGGVSSVTTEEGTFEQAFDKTTLGEDNAGQHLRATISFDRNMNLEEGIAGLEELQKALSGKFQLAGTLATDNALSHMIGGVAFLQVEEEIAVENTAEELDLRAA